jgi:D-beta-D-heptose 7-phosphate kinase/D-beta-D-heptose 1-phosphate adenosyltransferase
MKNQILNNFLENNNKKRLKIHCVGDAMIDEYYKVKVNRISPEHPVPVMVCQNDVVRKPGGSANVAYQFKHLNVDTQLICFYDKIAFSIFSQHNIPSLPLEVSNLTCCLPIKRRYLDNGVQVAPRHDFEKKLCGLSLDQIDIFSKSLISLIKDDLPDVAILSDYDKGFFQSEKYRILDHYKNVITIVDPKNGPLDKWKGCTIFKPNSKEAESLSGKKNWKDQAKFIQEKIECESVVITFGGEKVAGIWKNDFFVYTPDKQVNVESVIGAGDCFAAFFASAIGHGFNPIEAAEISWTAGSVYVQQRMNRPVVPAELSPDKIVSPDDLTSRDFKLVFTNGCFDILHKGHIETLKFCKSKGDKLVVALNSDESIKKFKDKLRPIVPLEHRMAVMSAIEFVDFVVCFDQETPLDVIKKIKPDVIVKGCGYQEDNIVGADLVPEVFIALTIEDSSTTKFAEDWFDRKLK